MNDLISGSFIKKVGVKRQDDIESRSSSNLDKFFDDVEAVQEYMLNVTKLHKRLQVSNEESKIACNAKTMKDLRARMDSDVVQVLKTVKIIKNKLEALGKANTAHRKLPGCGTGSSTDRTRTSVVNGLGKKLKELMNDFQRLRMKMTAEYKETVERRYFTITGERPDEQTVENLISSGESEIFLQKAIEEQGKGQILDTILEIQERHDSVKEIEKNLIELHQVFLDMAALVESQGHRLHTIESHVAHASSFVKTGTVKMENGKQGTTVNQGTENIDVESVMAENSCRKWACIAFSVPLLSTVSRSCQRLLLRTKNEIASFNMKDSKCKSVVAKKENEKDYSEHALT